MREGLDWRVTQLTFKAHSKFAQFQKYINSLEANSTYINNETTRESNNNINRDTVNYVALAMYKDD